MSVVQERRGHLGNPGCKKEDDSFYFIVQGWEKAEEGRTLATSHYDADQQEDICALVSQAAAFIRDQETPQVSSLCVLMASFYLEQFQ